ncbi:hypothetical protein HOLleu_05295 [Holothuria leucospilota]|uniref:Peptidase aspartic putative domain-containing protein n=1 Tax=Holothuria leucospilota TaxID=206669 RepID=A0A9Q1CLE7_HOLLE|nr:hypothetical protein HOLleu_05295 [Holothuria leucospilota]
MRVVPVKVQANSKEIQTWALLEEGSDVTLCDRKLVEVLDVQGISKKYHLTTINEESSEKFGLEVDLTVSDMKGNESVYLSKVSTVDKLPISEGNIPNDRDISKWSHLQGINFPMIEGKQIMLLIGVDVPEVFWVLQERRGRRKEPYAIRSILGWTLIGPMKASEGQSSFHTHYVKHEDTLLERQVERFGENDMGDLMIDIQEGESIEDRRAKSIMEKSLVKVDGHYQIGLPSWRHGERVFPNNRPYVEARLRLLKKKTI